MDVPPAHRQHGAAVALEWGPAGIDALADAEIAIIVDVLSFTTTLSVALDTGAVVFPYPWRAGAEDFAREREAVTAVGRSRAHDEQVSLSPASMRTNAQPGMRIVLPSPNGATLAHRLQGLGICCIGASLRNATAVAEWIAGQAVSRIGVIPAGERWPDGSLRPAVEDLLGAGAVVAALVRRGAGSISAEAQVAASAYTTLDDPAAALRDCASGRELIDAGFPEDVAIAAEVDASSTVPVLDGPAFTNVGS
jgi:2-phosphosulfolactate phosphatase